jgi:hypothetical protein
LERAGELENQYSKTIPVKQENVASIDQAVGDSAAGKTPSASRGDPLSCYGETDCGRAALKGAKSFRCAYPILRADKVRAAAFSRNLLYTTLVDGAGEDSSPIEENPMKKMFLAALLSTVAATAFAQDATTCKGQAASKKLAGAALNSFMTKCEKDSTATCQTNAADKKLAGAAKTSFVTKCVKDAVGG